MDELINHLAKIPKAELHVHLEGTVSIYTLRELANKNGIALDAPVHLAKKPPVFPPKGLIDGTPCLDTFIDFIGLYLKISEVIKTPEDLIEVTTSYGKSAKAQGIEHIEMYFSPTTFESLGTNVNALFDALITTQRAQSRSGITIRWIFDIVRNAGVTLGQKTVDFACTARDSGLDVVAIGLAGYEAIASAKLFAQAFQRARNLGFQTVAHAGETAGAESVRETIQTLKPKRLGHAIRALEDQELIDELIQSQTPIEVCPWSNIILNLTKRSTHPIVKMHRLGLNVIIGSDDPGIFGKNLIDNYMLAAELGATREELETIASKSMKARFS